MKKYCLHPGRLLVRVAGRDENGEPNGKFQKAWKYISAQDLIELYSVEESLCVTWGRDAVGNDSLIHLKPDPKGRYELPVMEPPEGSNISRKGSK